MRLNGREQEARRQEEKRKIQGSSIEMHKSRNKRSSHQSNDPPRDPPSRTSSVDTDDFNSFSGDEDSSIDESLYSQSDRGGSGSRLQHVDVRDTLRRKSHKSPLQQSPAPTEKIDALQSSNLEIMKNEKQDLASLISKLEKENSIIQSEIQKTESRNAILRREASMSNLVQNEKNDQYL